MNEIDQKELVKMIVKARRKKALTVHLATEYIRLRREKLDSKSSRDYIAHKVGCEGDSFCWSQDNRETGTWEKTIDLSSEDCLQCRMSEVKYREAMKKCAQYLRKLERVVTP